MRELSPVRWSDDGQFLVARDDASEELFAIHAGHRLTSLIDTRQARTGRTTGQLEITMESSLGPREIQARIRRGESPESLAESGGASLGQIMAFAGPVLAEREYMCEQARKASLRREHAASGASLGSAVADAIASGSGAPGDAVWDSWRREDGRWHVTVTPTGDEPAVFVFDAQSRYAVAHDDAARRLVGDVPTTNARDMAIADALVTPTVEPAAVLEPPIDDIAVELADGAGPAVRSLKEVRDRKALEQMALGTDDEPEQPVTHDLSVRDEVDEESAKGPRHKKPHERRRVPSWDEIMFGGNS